MPEPNPLQHSVSGARVDPEIFALRPGYRAALLAVDGLVPGPSDASSEALLQAAGDAALEALLRRAAAGLPRVNRLTDIYNAVSVLHQVPVGGEDLARYVGPPRLVRATGQEHFDTVVDGVRAVEHPDPGEVVWCDEAGVTCRRWNWRQARRTRLHDATTSALFIVDALDPLGDEALAAAVDELAAHLTLLGPDERIAQRVLTPTSAEPEEQREP